MSVFESPPSAPKPQRQPSFVGLPPISPGPEFGSALGITAADLEDRHRAVSPPGHLQGPSPHSYYINTGGNRIANAIFNADTTAFSRSNNAPTNAAFNDSRDGAQPGPVPGASPLASPTMNNYQLQSSSPHPHGTQFMQGPYVMMQSPHLQQPAAQHFPPAAHQFGANGSGNGNPNIMHHQPGPSQPGYPGQKGPVSYQQFQSSSPPPAMPSPSLMSNGQFNVPPGWKMEQSQLQQPLSSPRHRHSPSISSLKQNNQTYAIDKETGALSTRSVSPPTHSPTDSRRPGQPALVSSAGPSSQNGEFRPPNAPFMQQTHGAVLARSSTNITQNSQFHDEPESKRTSNVFSSIRNRLAGNGNDQRDALTGRPQPNGGLTGDDVSDASIPVDDQGRRGPSNFFGLRGNGQPNGDGAPFSNQGLGGAPFSPPKEKRPFFNRPSGLGINSSSNQEVSRPATAEGVMGPPVVGFGPAQPKKRFSKITGMLNRDKTENQPSQPLAYGTTQGQRPSFQGQRPPGGAMGYSDQMNDGQMPGSGRPRSSTAGSRPSISDHARTPSGQGYGSPTPMGAIAEEDRGRKPSGGNLLSNIFGKRSDSKNREHAQQRPPRSPPGLDQPQGLNPQGQMLVVQRPGQSGFFLPVQSQQLSMQGQPVLPPQGQYASLLQNAQRQQQQQQQYLGQGMPNGQDPMQRQPSPGISPVTQSTASPLLTTQAPGVAAAQRQQHMQQGSPLSAPQNGQEQQQPLGVVQVATAVPIRQVGNSPNMNSGQFQGGISPGGQSDSSRQRSASVVNQIDVGGARKPSVDLQGTRNRAASQSLAQQHPVHIASLHAPNRPPGSSSSPRHSSQFQPQDAPFHGAQNHENGTPISSGQLGSSFPSQTRRVSQGVMAGQQSQGLDQQAVSVQSSPSASPAPNPNQQTSPPGVPPKNSPAPNPGQGFGSAPTQSWQSPGAQGQSAPIAQQSSVYRPSGPQIAAVVQSFSQQQPQSPWSIGRQNGFGQPGAPGQQFPPGQSPQGMMMTSPPPEQRSEKEGTFSKFIKSSKTFVHQISDSQSLNDKPKSEKESKGMKGMMGVFKRPAKESKQPESGKPPPGGPQWAIQSGQVPPSMQQHVSSQSPQGKPTAQRLPQMQMPPKAQQVMGIGEGEQKIPVDPQDPAPQSQASQAPSQAYGSGQPSPDLPRAQQPRITSQPYPDNKNERPSSQKPSPPMAQQQVRPQQQGGRPSISGDISQSPREVPPHQQQQQQRRPSQPPIGQTQSQTAAAISSNMRAHNLKQQTAQRAPEPQYAPVPIPQGYATVHGEGMAAAKQDVMRAPPYGQPLPLPQSGMPYQGPPQQWIYPGMAPDQMPVGMSPHMVQQGWPQYPPYQGTPPPMVMAQHPPPQQQYLQGHHATPSPPLQGQQPPPHMPAQQHMPQPPVQPQFMAAAPGHQQDAPQQTVSPSHYAGYAPSQQIAPAPTNTAQAAPNNGQERAAPQPQQQLSPVPDASPVIPVQMDKGSQPQLHQPEAVKPDFAQTPFQAVPRSAFAVVKPQPGQDQLQPQQGSNLIPQRQTSGASEVSSLTSVPATNQGGSSTQSSETIHQVQHQAANVSPERIVISPEPAYERPPVTLTDDPPKTSSPATSASTEQEDIYGATPRQSRHVSPVQPKDYQQQQQQQQQNVAGHIIDRSPAQEPSGEPESKFAGPLPNRSPETKPAAKYEQSPAQQGFVVDVPPVIVEPATATTPSAPSPGPRLSTSKSLSPEEVEPPSPTDSELGKKRTSDSSGNTKQGEDAINGGGANGPRSSKPVQTSQEIFEEHKRKQLVRDMEEKIALNPTEPDDMMLGPGGKKKGEDAPLMSATSYPGQEWNPYGDAWIDDDL